MPLGLAIGYHLLGYAVLVLVIYTLAVMRIVRLINGDTILDRLRLIPARRAENAREAYQEAQALGQTARAELFKHSFHRWNKVLYFIGCPWCVSMWVAFSTVWIPLWFHDNWVARYFAIALAVSHLVGLFARFADTEEIEIEDDDDQ
ncbi:hypothetical protein I5G62_gp10 [Mycobacterium phage CRB2]|uniref:Uncharacterized protein n=1 Tax=Mycobacterium phage CRB2 TaxID=2483623 RepID=A0A455LLZ1_9CAUD|nr:hypothetical protein I5G62_gp10 [Mycobacterium phage CRB2]AYP69996.1 hypothetical protein CRB2_10 [Mycobacterium phage CRB2]